MPQMKIQIVDWESSPTPAYSYECLSADTVIGMSDSVPTRGTLVAPEVTSYEQRLTAFFDQFAAELDVVFGAHAAIIRAAINGIRPESAAIPASIDWEALRSDSAAAEGAARHLAAMMVASVLSKGMDSTPGDQQEQLVSRRFLSPDRLPEGLAGELHRKGSFHTYWRRGVTTADDMLQLIGQWFGQFGGGDEALRNESLRQAAHVAAACGELKRFAEQDMVTQQKTIKGAVYSVPIEPPLHLLDGLPEYDNVDLSVRVIPYVAGLVAEGCVHLEDGIEAGSGGGTLVLRNWHSTDSSDLERLTRLFNRLRAIVRAPNGQEADDVAAPDLLPLLEKLGCRPLAGLPKCWQSSGGNVLGFRTVDHLTDGFLARRRLQICAVLGLRGGATRQSPLADELMRRGGVTCWVDNGLVCVGCETDMPVTDEDLGRALNEFVDFAVEIRQQMYIEQTVGEMLSATALPDFLEPGTPPNDWIVRLRGLPVRLEVDFDRMRRHWYRQRVVADIESRLGSESVEMARGMVAAMDSEDDRNYVRARFVLLLFAKEPETALAELDRVEFGQARHDATVEVLEAASEGARVDMAGRVFARWLETDARRFDYQPDCIPLLEQAASGLGLAHLHQGYGPETAPAVCCDWLNFIFSRSPRSRRDPDWLSRLDTLTNDEHSLHDLHLDRLTDLFLTLQRYDLPGRRNVMAAIKAGAASSAYLAYYEAKLNLSLHSPVPGSAA